jgi:hypothetical protein
VPVYLREGNNERGLIKTTRGKYACDYSNSELNSAINIIITMPTATNTPKVILPIIQRSVPETMLTLTWNKPTPPPMRKMSARIKNSINMVIFPALYS